MNEQAETGSATYNYQGAKVLVTGGTSGIGAATAFAFRDAGAEVTIAGTRPSLSDYDKSFSGFGYHQCDVTDSSQVDALANSIDQLDVLVHSAGIALVAIGIDESIPDNFERAVRMHLTSVYRLTYGCLDKLTESSLPAGGSVIGIASMSSYFGMPNVPGYGAAKAGLVQLMKTMATSWSDRGIRANAIAAGMIITRQTRVSTENEQVARRMLSRTPMKRFGEAYEIADAALFLSSKQASYITGQTLSVCGGFSIAG